MLAAYAAIRLLEGKVLTTRSEILIQTQLEARTLGYTLFAGVTFGTQFVPLYRGASYSALVASSWSNLGLSLGWLTLDWLARPVDAVVLVAICAPRAAAGGLGPVAWLHLL